MTVIMFSFFAFLSHYIAVVFLQIMRSKYMVFSFPLLIDRRAQNRATTPGSSSTVSIVVHMQPTEENVATG